MRNAGMLTFLIICLGFNTVRAQGTVCDTINSPVPGNWSDTSYRAPSAFPDFPAGYINGVDGALNIHKANYFDLSATSYTYITGAIIKFIKANSTISGNLSKLLYFKVYADNAGVPGALLGSAAQVPLSQVKSDVAAGVTTNINFPAPIALPVSKKFYVSVDVSNFKWQLGGNTKDSIAIAGTADDEVKPNAAWEYSKDSVWAPFTENWENPADQNNPLDVTLWIFPYVSTSAAGCGLLPVKLLSFNAERHNADVLLTWKISDEINMKGYQIEKAGNNGIYAAIASLPAINSLKNQQYSAMDKNAFNASKTVQYRLRQIDGDGSVQYSKIISLSSTAAITDVVFANPFSGALKLQINLAEQQTVSFKIYDMQGRLAATQAPALYGALNSVINFNATSNLKPGTYLLQVYAGQEQKIFKVIKQ